MSAHTRRPTRGATESAYYFACNRSKQSVTVNLRAPEGQTIIRDLAREADVFLENFPVGTLKRYGLDYGAIRAVNERIVYVSCTGFGQSGPFAHRKGYDTIFQAMGGIMSLTGERGGYYVDFGATARVFAAAGPDFPRRLGRLSVGFNPAELTRVRRERARLEEPRGPKPLVHSHAFRR